MSLAPDDGPDAPTSWARLMVIWPRPLTGTHPLSSVTTLGRDPGPAPRGLQISHRTISRRHLEVHAEGRKGTFVAADLGSRNGSWINAVPVGGVPRVLRTGDVVRLGEVLAVFEQGLGTLADDSGTSTEAVIGSSARAIELRHTIARAARDGSPVTVIGESGTGKESVARELHRLSRREGPLVVANCATLTRDLADSQLFGHERGAFTGAIKASAGLFRSADGGSLFLDEIGELPLSLQPKLLRAVERGEVVPLGDTRTLTVDTRIITATNRDLAAEVEQGRFRRDLYARLSLLRVRIPPLRERRADLLAWLDVLHRRWRSARGDVPETPLDFSAEALEQLLLHAWPENLRGLDHLVHQLSAKVGEERITRAYIGAWGPNASPDESGPRDESTSPTQPSSPSVPSSPSAPSSPSGTEQRLRPPKPSRDELLAVLETHAWNLRAVARHYARDRRQIYRWLDSMGIERKR